FSRNDRSVFSPPGAYISTRAGVPFVCRHFVSARAEVPKRRLCNSFIPQRYGLGTVLRSLCRIEEVEQDMKRSFWVPPAETLVQAHAHGADVAVRTSERGSQNSDRRDRDVRGGVMRGLRR